MSSLVLRRLGLSLLLAAFVLYAIYFAPPDKGHEPSFFDLMRGRGPAHNPAIFAAFNLLGVIPLIYWGLLFPDGRGQRVRAWPFALAMMALGSFALLPYLILRRPYREPISQPTGPIVQWFSGRPFGVFVTLALVGLLIYGVGWGDFRDYVYWFRTSNFVHTFTVDFVLLTALFPTLLPDDFARRQLSEETPLARFALSVPLLGPALYLARRPAE